jgi:SH3-like domain-containing protein
VPSSQDLCRPDDIAAKQWPIQPSLTVLAHTLFTACAGNGNPQLSYQMAVTRQSFRAVGLGLIVAAVAASAHLFFAVSKPARAAGTDQALGTGAVSGLPVPRFVSLKSDRVNVRGGPNKDQDVRWVYTRAGMPVEVTAEFENWRRIRDWEGSEGWVYHSMLSGKRTAVVVPKLNSELVPLYGSRDTQSAVVARLQSGVLASLKSCDGAWCEISGKSFGGWIQQDRLWGAYPNEKVD